ncbi:membrane protein insertase YidC [Parapedobacter sp. DT-150]|uniref:membrane protein insertase YidC n=1 Tax=Parapedobacter sp. DT-150 TaxID=3396162 RepID=UPI003F1966F2
MDKNSITGLVLIFIIIAGSFYLLQPSDEELKRERQLQDSLARTGIEQIDTAAVAKTAPIIDSARLRGPFGQAIAGEEKTITLENEHIRAVISTKGGRVKSVELKDEKTYDSQPLMLFDGEQNKFGLFFSSAGKNITTNDLYFTTEGKDIQVVGQDSASVTFRLSYAADQYIDYVYSIKGGGYTLGFTIITKGMQEVVAPTEKQLVLNWEAALSQKEKDMDSERQRSTLYYALTDGEVDHLNTTEDDEETLAENVKWISFKQHFFSNVLVADNGFDGGKVNVYTSVEDHIVKLFAANLQLDFSRQDINTYPMHFFFGPNQYNVLKAHGQGLEEQIDMGWGPMKWINRFITIPVFNFLDSFNWSYGLVILILTVMLKLVLSPLTYRSYVSMAKMRVLKPEMDQIKEKVGQDNPTLLQQEYLKLYKQAGVNPLGGCIPLILQMPFTIAFFFFFPNLFELRGESFLWVKDLSTYDSPISFAPLPLIGMDHISLMCILMTIATLLSTWYNNSITGATGQMKYIGYFMPLIFLFVLNSFPAGLNYYYFLSTVITFGQQLLIRNMINDDKILSIIEANKKKKPVDGQKKSKFQQRMEDYMRQQQGQAKKKK